MTPQVASLVDQLLAIDAQLSELLGPEVDSVTDGRGRTLLLRKAQEELRLSERLRQSSILDVLPAQVALLDEQGTLVSINEAWRVSADTGPTPVPSAVGEHYVAACEAGPPSMRRAAAGIRAVLQGRAPEFVSEYQLHAGPGHSWFSMRVLPVAAGGAVVMHMDITDRRRMAEDLARLSLRTERRERMLSSMLSATTDLTYAMDRRGHVLWANENSLRTWGVSLQEATGRDAHQLGFSPAQAEEIERAIEAVFQHGKLVGGEMSFMAADGTVGDYEYTFNPARGPDGGVEFVSGCSRDITARKRSEQALLESAAEFRTLATAMPQIVWASAPDGEVIYLNSRWIEYTGRTLADSLGWSWLTAVHPDDAAMTRRELSLAIQARGDFSLQARVAAADGSYRWWLLRGVPVQDNGRLVKWVGTCTDVDELKSAQDEVNRANAALQQQGNELRTLFDVVPAMVWLKDRQGRIMQINHRAASLSGLSVEEARGRLISELFPGEAEAYAREDRQIFATGRPLPSSVEQVRDADGRAMWLQADKVPCFGPDGSVVGVMVMKHDISERRQAQESLRELNQSLEVRVRERTAELALARDEAEQANRAKSTFLATMSHEIRTPMSGLLGLLELLDLSSLDHEQRSTLRVARESGQALKDIIDGVLDFSKIEANSLEVDPVPASLRQLIEGIVQLHAPVASGKNVLLTASCDPLVGESLRFDPLRLGQVLNNLVGNAIKFTDQGSITVQAELLQRSAGREHLRLTVRDTGIGIEADRLDRLFQPFVQAHANTSTRYGGTGLGLFIARRLAELMHGTLSIASRPGAGTTMTLTVAFDICESSTPERFSESKREQLNQLVATRPPPPTVDRAEAEGTLLLVVDDHPINRMVLMRQVSILGYASESAADGLHALKAWESGRFAGIITDCNMPRMNGFELARAIREQEARRGLRRIPVIGCTANALADAAVACLEAGMDDSVTKPVALEDICTQLDRWIALPSMMDGDTLPAAAPRAPAPPTNGLLDLALLEAVAGGDPAAVAQMLADFRRTNEEDAAELRRAARRDDFAQVVHYAHRVRGASAMLGATMLADASASVQESAATGQPADVHASMQEFEMELLRLNNYLDTLP
ncbi:MAG: PAS domain S-box protein [Ramlibacter sp.]